VTDWLPPLDMSHLIVVPILLPLLAAALMLLLGERRRPWKTLVNVAASLAGLVVAVMLLRWVDGKGAFGDGGEGAIGTIGVYLPSNWQVPFGIVLVVDRLSALMLVVTAVVSLACVLFSVARWQRAGVHFHPLFQLQLMGLNGAFLTADLFNLFVFFEVMLVASYGLLLHGSGRARVRAGLHYIAVNLFASSLFLIGVAVLYGVTGTLNMADMAQRIGLIDFGDRGLLHAGAALLALAFLAKAALWPLNFWLVPAYAAASAPVAALFAIMTKVGVYAVLRLWTLFFPPGSGEAALFGADVLVWGGLATLAFGAIGVLASHRLSRLAGFSLIVSSGTLLAAIGFEQVALTGAALFYLASSTFAACALFLLFDLVERSRQTGSELALPEVAPEFTPFGVGLVDTALPPADANLDDLEQALVGQTIPAAMVFLGLSFMVCTLLITGLPPLSGFVAKFAMLSALLDPGGRGAGAAVPGAAWTFLALLIGSGLAAMIALSRSGIRYFWAPQERPPPRLRVIECAPIVALLLACTGLMVGAGPALRYAQSAADTLHHPSRYIDAVMSTRPVGPRTGVKGAPS
jgi:multicomponent K+:H+ antiporter subunit D